MNGRKGGKNSNRSTPWDRECGSIQGPSPLLPGTSSRFPQPGAVTSPDMSRKSKSHSSSGGRGAKWQAMWDEPANSTVKYTTLKPPSDVAYKAVNPVDAEEGFGGNEFIRRESDQNHNLQISDNAGGSGPTGGGGRHGSRHTAQTELQVLDTKRTWMLLCLPAIFVVFVLAFPPSWSIEINTLELPFGRGGDDMSGRKLNANGEQIAQLELVGSEIELHMNRSIQAMRYVQLSVQLADTARRTLPLSSCRSFM